MSTQSQHPLRGLLVAQFFGAFNDNAWKLTVALLAIGTISSSDSSNEAAWQTQTAIAFVVFTLPLMLFSLPAGALADRVSKRSVFVFMKACEIGLMAAGTAALAADPTGTVVPLVILGLMGVQSALLSPAKFGILPEILPHDRLSTGNAALQMWTFLAIIAGTGSCGFLLDTVGEQVWIIGAILTALAVVGFVASQHVPRVPPARSEGGLVHTVRSAWAVLRQDRVLRLAVAGQVFFWSIASLLGQDILVYAKALTSHLERSDTLSSLPLALFGLGVGAGSILAAKLSASKVEYGLVPLGAVGFGLFTFLLGIIAPGLGGTLVIMVFLGISAGLLIVPLNALVQWRSPDDHRGAVIALANVFIFAGVLAGSLAAVALAQAGLSARGILIFSSIGTLAGTCWALWLLPDAFLRLVLILLTHTFYRLRVVGASNVPQQGGALLVPNHVSFVDGLFLLSSIDRPLRFIVESRYFHRWWLRPFLKSLGAIPISASGGPRVILRALRDAGRHLDEGELVCIFAEGQMTRTGTLLAFRKGLERIVKGRSAPILPSYLDQVWGSIFSREGGRYLFKWPKSIPYRVTVSYGRPLPAGTPISEVRRAVQELSQDAWTLRKPNRRPLHHGFVRACRSPFGGFRMAFADAEGGRLSRRKALAAAVALARALRRPLAGQDKVGILLPSSIAGALANVAAALSGRTSVNLNYTAGAAAMQSAARQAGLRTVVTSREFVRKANLELPQGLQPLWIEDILHNLSARDRLSALLLGLFTPIRFLERACGAQRPPNMDDLATIIFSSGSTGDPKGIMLTHFNVDSNVEAIAQVFDLRPYDRILGILPFFHSFGFLALWFACNHNMPMVFHTNPFDAAVIGELVQRHRLTILLATPTFLQVYLRRCTPSQFGSVRLVLAGAEKLSQKLAQAFEDHFGVQLLEGYGTTECSPGIATSTLDFRAPGFYQPGSRRGFVGHTLPGVAVRIVDPDTFEPLPPETPGMLIVKGPNVMRGYLGKDDLTAACMRDGWYVTGDIAMMTEDGFIKITDRLSRFSKIGGEMVPHGRIEEALHEAAGSDVQVFAVTSVPDERKGERLAVLHTLDEEAIAPILEALAPGGLPNLFIPRRDHFVKVENLPVLGTGKLDLREAKRIAAESLNVGL